MWRIVLPLTLVLALTADAAGAAQRTGNPVLAATGSTPDGRQLRLYAQDTDTGGLCLDVETQRDQVCAKPPAAAVDDLRPRTLTLDGATVVYGAVTAATDTLELTLSTGRPVRLRTQKGQTTGSHRFYIAALRGAPVIAATAALDDEGDTRAALDLNLLALPPFKGRATVAFVRDELNRPSDVVALDTKILAPTQADPGRRKRALCVGLKRRDLPTPIAGRAVCATRTNRLDVRFAADCTTGRSVYYGFAPSVVRRARAILADGSVRAVALKRIPKRLGHRARAVVLELPGAIARQIRAYDSRGRRIATVRLVGGDC
jgi:hypothetical protein